MALCTSGKWNMVLVIDRPYSAQNVRSSWPLEFSCPIPWGPMTSGHDWESLPTRALKSPSSIYIYIYIISNFLKLK